MNAVVDSNVFMRGRANLEFERFYTVPSVMDELESPGARLSFDAADVRVEEPSDESLEKVRQKSDEINSPTSGVDEELLALALDMGEVLVTDDLALQNLASHTGVRFRAYMGDEIEEERIWVRVCGNCGEEVEGERCPRCGQRDIKRKPG